MSFVNLLIDSLPSEDVIDLYFIMSDLVDINLTDSELCECASFDSLASATAREYNGEKYIPIGKQVF
jgi:hypothetical protein